jgi:hypothetical protein
MFKNIQVVVFFSLMFFVGSCGVKETYVPYGSGGYKCHEKTDVKTLKFQTENTIGLISNIIESQEIPLDTVGAKIPLSIPNLNEIKKQAIVMTDLIPNIKEPLFKAKKEPLSLEKRALRNANLSLIFSLLGIAGIPILLTLLFGPLAIYTGYRAKAQGLKGKGSGRANWGIALGIIFTTFVGLFIYLADIGAFSWM